MGGSATARSSRVILATLSACVAMGAAQPVSADAGGIVGGIVGAGPAVVFAAEREQNRLVQEALSYFGFPAGAPDGVLGRQSRAAVGAFQATLGFPPSGYLTEYQRAALLTYHARARAAEAHAATQSAQERRSALFAYHANRPPAALGNTAQPQLAAVQPRGTIAEAPAP